MNESIYRPPAAVSTTIATSTSDDVNYASFCVSRGGGGDENCCSTYAECNSSIRSCNTSPSCGSSVQSCNNSSPLHSCHSSLSTATSPVALADLSLRDNEEVVHEEPRNDSEYFEYTVFEEQKPDRVFLIDLPCIFKNVYLSENTEKDAEDSKTTEGDKKHHTEKDDLYNLKQFAVDVRRVVNTIIEDQPSPYIILKMVTDEFEEQDGEDQQVEQQDTDVKKHYLLEEKEANSEKNKKNKKNTNKYIMDKIQKYSTNEEMLSLLKWVLKQSSKMHTLDLWSRDKKTLSMLKLFVLKFKIGNMFSERKKSKIVFHKTLEDIENHIMDQSDLFIEEEEEEEDL